VIKAGTEKVYFLKLAAYWQDVSPELNGGKVGMLEQKTKPIG